MITTLGEKIVVARKPHSCGFCGLAIAKGDKHHTQRNADDGHIWTWRAHIDCDDKYPAYLEWCGIEAHWVDDYETPPHDEFRAFLADQQTESETA